MCMCVCVLLKILGKVYFFSRIYRVLPNLCDYFPTLGFYFFIVVNSLAHQSVPTPGSSLRRGSLWWDYSMKGISFFKVFDPCSQIFHQRHFLKSKFN